MIPFPVQQCTGFFCCRGIFLSNPSDLPAPSVRETYSRGKLSDFAGNLAAAAKAFPLGAQARAAGEKAGFSLARDTENGPEWVAFSAALQYDYNINYLTLTPEQAEPFYK